MKGGCSMLNNILFITDDCDYEKEYSLKSKDSEGNKKGAKLEMTEALQKLALNVHCTYSISEANEFMSKNKDAFTVTTYYGEAAPDSKSIIPSLCKTNKIKYLGADAYTQMICNDKYLSKKVVEQFGLNSIKSVLIYSPDNAIELNSIKGLSLPLIVKPNFGGGSNGIMNCSYVTTYEDAFDLVRELYNYQNLPILVEEYIPGNEFSFIIIGNKKQILFSDESMLTIDNQSFFEKEVFGLESKKIDVTRKKYEKSSFVDTCTRKKMFNLFHSFDKVEFMRIDCRVNKQGAIYILELSPDCYIGTNGAFFETVKRADYTFNDMIKMLVENSINSQNY